MVILNRYIMFHMSFYPFITIAIPLQSVFESVLLDTNVDKNTHMCAASFLVFVINIFTIDQKGP